MNKKVLFGMIILCVSCLLFGKYMIAKENEKVRTEQVEKLNHKVIQSFRLLVDLAGFEIVGRVTLKHKKSGKVFK